MTIKKFEVGKTYYDRDEDIAIIVTKRVGEKISYKFTKQNWYEKNLEKEFTRTASDYLGCCESFLLENHHSAPQIIA